ncbi:hypothetical protein DKT69_26210 [Micromonospora sicca]|uniref:Uncharacterized protein n=1 Tax=Micromonospora sicca TaxID=2202420 RepID=A0A317D9X7_9ACTN|nr:hypothetical protein [Micromonospora sp. ATA51]PWR11681.1 hypothetical protein DKT69_26210 [Micromonospora sp. 4G51]
MPSCGSRPSRQEIAADVHRWVVSPPMRDLVDAFGGTLPATAGEAATASLLAWLDDFSDGCWNFRKGAERPDAREPDLDAAERALVLAAAEALGLVRATTPRHDSYTHLIVLGGLARACLQRNSYAAALLASGRVGRPEVAALGSGRELTKLEHELLRDQGAPGCRNEMDVMDVGVRRYLGFRDPVAEEAHLDPDNTNLSSCIRTYQRDGGPTVRVLAAPSSDPERRRANTADTQRYWAEQVTLTPNDRVLVVTSAIYVPFQHADALRTLGVPFDVDVDTVGVEADWSHEPSLHQPVTPGKYLQEIRSGIRSMRSLLAAVEVTTPASAPV